MSDVPVVGPVIKPSTMSVRPSSASGNIQSHPMYTTGLYDKKCLINREQASTNKDETDSFNVKRATTNVGYLKMATSSTKVIEPKDQVEKIRRRTIELSEGIDFQKFIGREMSLALSRHNILEKIEERLDIDVLEDLKNAFVYAEKHKNGTLDLEEFKSVLIEKLQLPHSMQRQTENLFKKIDWASTQAISWDNFCTYMQLEYAEKEDIYLKAREMAFNLPARLENTPHRENVCRIMSSSDGTFIAGSTDGILSFWNSSLELKKTRSVLTSDQSQRLKSKWIIDFLVMTEFNKIIVATGDRELEFFELSSFEPYCRIHSLETVPLCLDYHVDRDNPDDSVILWGDRQGCVNILHLYTTGECLRTWKKQPRSEGIASIDLLEAVMSTGGGESVTFGRWKVHNDWLLKIKYYDSLRQVISCSKDDSTALVIGCLYGSTSSSTVSNQNQVSYMSSSNNTGNQHQTATKTNNPHSSMSKPKKRLLTEQTVFDVYKGIQTFDFGSSKNVLVTGGLDRIIRIWNPYVNSKPTGMLRGHNKPIVHLHIAESENRIFSICADKCIKVWDIHDHNCLLTVRPKGHQVRGDLQSCHYSEAAKTLMLATDQMAMLNIKVKPVLHTDVAISHKDPVNCCRYNDHFNSIVTCCEGSIVKLWNFDNGQKIFEFDDAHEDGAGVTCVTFDSTGRRLLTGGRDGCVRMWNFNNGQCLTKFIKEEVDEFNHYSEEIHDVKYVEISRNKFIIAVGWDKAINVYIDQCDSTMNSAYFPTPRWPDDLENGHQDDILAMATFRGQLLATADYNGTILIWNLMSGHLFFKLTAPPLNNGDCESNNTDYLDEDLSINKLIFLQERYGNNKSASLVSSGPYGLVHFWNVKQGGKLYARFKGGLESGQSLTTMATCIKDDKKEGLLLIGDRFGFISVWNMENYAKEEIEIDCPELVNRWRAHTGSVTDMDVVPHACVLITASDDRTVRLWTFNTTTSTLCQSGQFIGTLGQTEPWDLTHPPSFQHPMVPFDVLVDARSMPDHPVLGPRMSVEQRRLKQKDEASEKRKQQQIASKQITSATRPASGATNSKDEMVALPTRSMTSIDDKAFKKLAQKKAFKEGEGKRLQYEKYKNSIQYQFKDGGPNEFRSLKIYELEKSVDMVKPNFSQKPSGGGASKKQDEQSNLFQALNEPFVM